MNNLLLVLFWVMIINSSYTQTNSSQKAIEYEQEVPFTEDLMREHGILRRILLIYEEIIRRIDHNIHFQPKLLQEAVDIIKSFIENYHEKLEEEYIFPLFKNHKKHAKLVQKLLKQHQEGRTITEQLQKIVVLKHLDAENLTTIKKLLHDFIAMYRPHASREDTVLFPEVRSLITPQRFEELSNIFEDSEEKLFGKNGFEKILSNIESIEKKLNIYELK